MLPPTIAAVRRLPPAIGVRSTSSPYFLKMPCSSVNRSGPLLIEIPSYATVSLTGGSEVALGRADPDAAGPALPLGPHAATRSATAMATASDLDIKVKPSYVRSDAR